MSATSINSNTSNRLGVSALLSSQDVQTAANQSKLSRPVADLFETTPITNGQSQIAHNETRTPTTTTATNPVSTTPTTSSTPTTSTPTTPTITTATTQSTETVNPNGVTVAAHMPSIGTVDTGMTEAKAAAQQFTDTPPPAMNLPAGALSQNADGSITTPGGYTVTSGGGSGYSWTITSPTGQVTKISGDPHVDEGNDGTNDWNFNTNGTFILGDGTKIYDATDHYATAGDGTDITVSHMVSVQYGDSLATMDVENGGATTLSQTGGKAFDAATPDGQVYVEGLDGKFYDGATLQKLTTSSNDAIGLNAAQLGTISQNAYVADQAALKEMGLTFTADLSQVHFNPDDVQKKVNEEDLGTLAELDNSSFLVDDSDNSLENAAAAHGAVGKGKILGQANQAGNGIASLAKFDTNGDGVLTGDELKNVKVWTDKNGDGKVDAGEISVLADFNVKSLNVKMAVTPQNDGNTRLDGLFNRDGNTVTTSDIINPLVQTSQGVNFQSELTKQLSNDPQAGLMAQANLNRVADLMNQLPTSDGPQQPGVVMSNTISSNRGQVNTRA